jgi:phosphogluconate dehydratase
MSSEMTNPMNDVVSQVTNEIINRSQVNRQKYLDLMQQAQSDKPTRAQMGCTNLAHVQASATPDEKLILKQTSKGHNVAIVTAYNDMLSAHQPYYRYPEKIKQYLYRHGASGQVASGVPAMCDGVTQGQPGMELSLFSRDVIALSTAVGLSHQAFDAMILLGICDKIVPGMLMGALRFGNMPGLFMPAGPMGSGITNSEKASVRQAHVQGKATDEELLESESQAYHSAGTCTFYGTANSNQMLLEAMGLMLPNSAFVHPTDPDREKFNQLACEKMVELADDYENFSFAKLVNEKSIVNALVALLATGGSTNLTIHWVAVARCAGINITWQDIQNLSEVVPLICKVYPNGPADINQFHAAGGTAWVFSELLNAGLMHGDVMTVNGGPFSDYGKKVSFVGSIDSLQFEAPKNSQVDILSTVALPFDASGGIQQVIGNLGKAVIKVSAVPKDCWQITAPARVFSDQLEVVAAYKKGLLQQDMVLVLKAQGPKANGMPELHKLMPVLANLQDEGFSVALLTDGRLSGASGKVLSAIHLVPEAANGGAIAKILDGDLIKIDAKAGMVDILEVNLADRPVVYDAHSNKGIGRELFSMFRRQVTPADEGAISIGWDE